MSGYGGNKGSQFVRTLRINSSNRTDPENSTDSNFYINIGPNVQQVLKVSPTSIQFPKNFYNVFQNNAKFNNAFALYTEDSKLGPIETTILIPPGYYTANQLMSAIQTAVLTANPNVTLTFTYDSITQRSSVSRTVGGTVTLVQMIQLTPPYSILGLPGKQDFNPFGLLGFDITTLLWHAADNTSRVGIAAPSLNNPSIAYISSAALSPQNSFDEDGKISNIIAQVDLGSTPQGAMASWECKQDILCEIDYGRPRMLSLIDIQLVDHDGDILDLQGGELNLFLRVWLNSY